MIWFVIAMAFCLVGWRRSWERDAAERRYIARQRLLIAIANQPDDDDSED